VHRGWRDGGSAHAAFIEIIGHLGYPPYFMTILGVRYVLAGIALLAPRSPRLKEWAYVGLVARALDGQSAVLSALGVASPLRRNRVLVEGVRHIVRSMEQTRVRRLVYLSFLVVPEGRTQLSLLGRTLVSRLLLLSVVADHVLKEEIIRGSGLDCIIVRPPRLTTGPRRGTYRHGASIRATSLVPTISRADLADFMLRQLEDDTYVRRAPAVMY
jgi:hypothetical protein